MRLDARVRALSEEVALWQMVPSRIRHLSYPLLTYPNQQHEIDHSSGRFKFPCVLNDDGNFGSAIGDPDKAEEVEVD